MCGMTPRDHVAAHEAAGRYFIADDRRSFVREAGDGPPVVLMHGVPASSYLYRKVIAELADRGLRGIAFDLLGLGLAEKPIGIDYSWTGLGRWSAAAVDALELDRIHLVVHDIGGPVGFEMIDHLAGRVTSLTILNTVTDPGSFAPPWPMRPFTIPLLDRLWLASTIEPAFVELMYWQGVADRTASSRAELAAYRELLLHADRGRAFRQMMKVFETTTTKSRQYRAAIRSVAHRQVVWGELDPALDFASRGRQAMEVAGLDDAVRLPGKHFLQEDNAPAIAEHVAALVAAATTA